MARKKRTQREQDRIANARWALVSERELFKAYKRSIAGEERRYKRLVRAVIACNKDIVVQEKRAEQSAERILKLQEKLKCLTASK
jgi:hypothetical protein